MSVLQSHTPDGDPRCQARLSYGDTWTAGRKQCGNRATVGGALCKVHANKHEKRIATKTGGAA